MFASSSLSIVECGGWHVKQKERCLGMTQRRKQDFGPLLTSEQQYRLEVGQLPRLTDEQERAIIERARSGDRQARDEVINICLPLILPVASRFVRQVRHADFLDLVQMGNLTVIEWLDRALQKDRPIAYLVSAVYTRFIRYLGMSDSLVSKKCCSDYGQEYVEVLSLDLPPSTEHELGWADLLEELPVVERLGLPAENWDRLYEAVASLCGLQRLVIERAFGLDGRPEEKIADIDFDLTGQHDPKAHFAYNRKY